MKTKIAAYIRVITLLLTSSTMANAQLGSLGISNFIYPDTAYEGTLYNISVTVQHTDSNSFNGNINIVTENTDTIYGSDTIVYNQTITLTNYLDTTTFQVTQYQFTPAKFKAGINIIVVWPRMVNGATINSSSYTDSVYFIPLSGVHGEDPSNYDLFLYPNPAKDQFSIVSSDHLPLEYVRIFDSKGALVRHITKPSDKINVHSLVEGLYLVEIKRKGVGPVYRNFIKQQE